MRATQIVISFLLVTISAAGTGYEYGTTAELKGVTTLYVDAADAVDLRSKQFTNE